MRRFEGKVVLITGGSTGIGRKTAHRIVAEGGTVFVASLAGDEVPDTHAVKLDITDETQWTKAVETVLARAGRLDVLVNNVGWDKFKRRRSSNGSV